MPSGAPVDLFTLSNTKGFEARIMTYGGTLVSLRTPDRKGEPGDVVLGFETLDEYLACNGYLGAIIGRYANRIARGRFRLEGREIILGRNDGENHLHGGHVGFDKVLWSPRVRITNGWVALDLAYESAHMEEGYPGSLHVEVTYTLTDDSLRIDYIATTNERTVVNLTNHAYFNLVGEGTVLGHSLRIDAARYLPVDEALIPTGERADVTGTPMDFRRSTALGLRLGATGVALLKAGVRETEPDFPQLRIAGGYDHTWVLDDYDGSTKRVVAELYEPISGREMTVSTTEPGLQFYSGNMLGGVARDRDGRPYEARAGLCLEAQHFPDSPNHGAFPSTELLPGQRYEQRTEYRFGVR
jgi:aldose 1-epimerase